MEELINYFQTLFNDNSNPCIITGIETKEVIFVNLAMEKLLKEHECTIDDITKSTDETLDSDNDICGVTRNEVLDVGTFVESHIYIKMFKRTYRVTNTLLQINGNEFNLCKYFLTSSYMNKQISFDDALNQTIQIFSQGNIDEMSNDFLELLGNFYQSEKSFIFYVNEDKNRLVNRYKWTKRDNLVVPDDATNNMSIEKLFAWIATKDANGIVEANYQIEETLRIELAKDVLFNFNASNITLCVIDDIDGKPMAAVGVSNREEIEFDFRLLKSIAHFIKDGFNKFGMQEELREIAETDFLTGFYSRRKYVEILEEFEKNSPAKLGVIFVNINGLRRTNEYLGYEKGDEKIRRTSKVIRETITDSFYRISGDEFVCFCVNENESQFMEKVDKIHDALKLEEAQIFSVGHAWKTGSIDVLKLINEADVVMYINKQEFYHNNDTTSEDVSDNTLKDLLKYISNDEFIIYLQPQIELKTEKVIGAEALIRRFDKTNRKMIFPDQFIPLYEQKSVIRHVDIFVVNQVCMLLSKWLKMEKVVPISVNLSRVTLMEYDIVDTISKICEKYDVPHELLVIEITERVGLIENDVATTLIDQFKEKGFKVSLDDFGCAYSNIVTLANISVNEVKVDKSLVDHLLDNKKNRVIVKSMIDMCNNLDDTNTLAEGIETREQADLLNEYNCSYGQGYLYSRPIPVEEFFDKYIKD